MVQNLKKNNRKHLKCEGRIFMAVCMRYWNHEYLGDCYKEEHVVIVRLYEAILS